MKGTANKCNCADYARGIDKINGYIASGILHQMPEYNGKPFKYCPWCGSKLKKNTEKFVWPFECRHCDNKPTPEDVLKYDGGCKKCRDEIVTNTLDAAALFLKLRNRLDIK